MYAPKREAFFAFKDNVNNLPVSLISTLMDLSLGDQTFLAGAAGFVAWRFDFRQEIEQQIEPFIACLRHQIVCGNHLHGLLGIARHLQQLRQLPPPVTAGRLCRSNCNDDRFRNMRRIPTAFLNRSSRQAQVQT